ncbi:MAG: N-acetyltransferase family protein [Caulobacteraceae bacterium]
MSERVRPATVMDAAGAQAIYGPEVAEGFASFEEEPPTVEEMAARISKTLPRYPWLVLDDGGPILGYAYASAHKDRAAYRWAVDVAAYVAPGARGRGVGRALYAALFPILIRQGFYTAHAGISLPNEASIALHRAFGFEPVGVYRRVGYKLGAWRDTCWMRKELCTPSGEPAEPIPFSELTHRA